MTEESQGLCGQGAQGRRPGVHLERPPSLGFSRQEHWSGLPVPSPMHESESEVVQSCLTLSDPWTAAYQAPLSMGFSRQEHTWYRLWKAFRKPSVSPPSLLPSVETVNDGQFHSVELVMLNQTLNLVVDKGAPKSLGKLQKQPAVSINSPLYLGGKPHLLPPVPCTLVPTPRPTGGAHSSHLSTHCQSQSREASCRK